VLITALSFSHSGGFDVLQELLGVGILDEDVQDGQVSPGVLPNELLQMTAGFGAVFQLIR